MSNSINTNAQAFVALQNLNSVNSNLSVTQNRVSTGLKVASAIDDASSFAIAQGIRGSIKAYAAVSQGIANARGVATVSLAGANAISDLLGDIQAKITQGENAGNSTAQQSILNADFQNLVTQINTFISNATYNGRNLLRRRRSPRSWATSAPTPSPSTTRTPSSRSSRTRRPPAWARSWMPTWRGNRRGCRPCKYSSS